MNDCEWFDIYVLTARAVIGGGVDFDQVIKGKQYFSTGMYTTKWVNSTSNLPLEFDSNLSQSYPRMTHGPQIALQVQNSSRNYQNRVNNSKPVDQVSVLDLSGNSSENFAYLI